MKDLVPLDGSEELKASTGIIRIFALEHPFSQDTIYCEAPVGLSIRQIIGCDRQDLFVIHNGELLPADVWEDRFPVDGDLLNIVPIPGDSSDVKRLVGTIALIALAVWAGPVIAGLFEKGLLASSTFWTASVFAVGQLVLNSLIPPPTLDQAKPPRDQYGITGSRNRVAPYEPVPILYGRHRTYPPYASLPYTEIIGNEQYLNMLFCVGIGDYDIEDIKVGETPLLDFDGADVSKTSAPVGKDVFEEALNLPLIDPLDPTGGSTTFTRTTSENTTEISIDIVLPAGLQYVNSKGDRRYVNIDFRVEYSPAGQNTWSNVRVARPEWPQDTWGYNEILGIQGRPAPTTLYGGILQDSPRNSTDFRVRANTRDPQRLTIKWQVTSGQYDVRVTRTYMAQNDPFNGTETELNKYAQNFVWTVLRSFNDNVNVVHPDVQGIITYLKVRIRASDQLNGVIDRLNLIATRKLRRWDSGTQSFTSASATRNPAWAFLDVLTGLGNSRAISDANAPNLIELDTLDTWASECETVGNESYYDDVINNPSSVFEILRRIAAVGRGAVNIRDGKFTVVRESSSATPVQHFTPRNTRNFSSVKTFNQIPHALRVRFISDRAGYVEDEIIVYDDGFNEDNATNFEVLELVGVTDHDQAWRMGRYHLAVMRLRPEIFTFTVDIEHLVAQKGDVCKLTHDVALIGVGAARIKSINGNAITLDDNFDLDGSSTYAIRVRLDDGSSVVQNIIENSGNNDTFTFTPSIPNGIKVGDLAILGISGTETIDVKITRIVPENSDHEVSISCVDAAPGVLTAHQGTIPDYNPVITVPVNPKDVIPPIPRIVDIRSDVNTQVLDSNGNPVARVIIAFTLSSQRFTSLHVQVRYRETNNDDVEGGQWKLTPLLDPANGYVAITDVEAGEEYEFQIRSITPGGIASDWSSEGNAQPNAGFEDANFSGWTIDPDTTATISSTQKHSGLYSAHVVGASPSSIGGLGGTWIDVRPGDIVTVRGWVMRDESNLPQLAQNRLEVHFRDETGTQNIRPYIGIIDKDVSGWQYFEASHEVPDGYTRARILFVIRSSETGAFYLDDFYISKFRSTTHRVTSTPRVPPAASLLPVTGDNAIYMDVTVNNIELFGITGIEFHWSHVNDRNAGTTVVLQGVPAFIFRGSELVTFRSTIPIADNIPRYWWARFVAGEVKGDWFPSSATGGLKTGALPGEGDLDEYFSSYVSRSDFIEHYRQHVSATDISFPEVGEIGGKVLQVQGEGTYIRRRYVEFDPSELYEVSVTVEQTVNPSVSGESRIFCGLEGVAADGFTRVNKSGLDSSSNQHYAAVANEEITVAEGKQTFVGYVRGYLPILDNANDPARPSGLHSLAKYIRPILWLNHQSGDGIAQIDKLTVRRIDPNTIPRLFDNLFGSDVYGVIVADVSSTLTELEGYTNAARKPIADLDLSVGDYVSLSAEMKTLSDANNAGLRISFWDAETGGNQIGSVQILGGVSGASPWKYYSLENIEIPVGATHIRAYVFTSSPVGAGTVSVRKAKLNRGPIATQFVFAPKGEPGADGTLKQYVFQRSATQPSTPSGDGIPAGWFDSPPAYDGNPLWTSVAVQELDGTTVGSWSTPTQLSGNDGRIKQYVFQRSDSQPSTPSGNGVPSGWSDTPPADNGQPLWMSVALQELDGTTVGSWSTPIRLTGDDGATWHSSSGAPSGALGVVGDFYLDEQTGNVYEKTDASTWTLRSNIQGPAGADGTDGATWHSGSGAPSGALGAIGDFYLNEDNGDVYEKTGSSTWTIIANIKGPQGDQGPEGPQGPKGDPGLDAPLLRWIGSVSWPTNTTIAGAVEFSFDTNLQGADCIILVRASDVDGPSVRIGLNGTEIGPLGGGGNSVVLWFAVAAEALLINGTNKVQIWSTSGDGGTILAVEVFHAPAGSRLSQLINIGQATGVATVGQLQTNVLAALQANVASLTAIVAELGSAVISTTGHLRSGQTAWDTGNGWFLGHTGAEPAFSMRSGSQYIRMKPSTGIDTNIYSFSDWGPTQTFTPTWTGFSVAPVGVLNYAISQDGRLAMLWAPADRIGTSNAANMSITNLPVAIRPAGASRKSVTGSGMILSGFDELPIGAWVWGASHAGAGILEFGSFIVTGTGSPVAFQRTSFATSGSKGLRGGAQIIWPL